eukprot:10638173-Heterocapsa_arctica.AAC.1
MDAIFDASSALPSFSPAALLVCVVAVVAPPALPVTVPICCCRQAARADQGTPKVPGPARAPYVI